MRSKGFALALTALVTGIVLLVAGCGSSGASSGSTTDTGGEIPAHQNGGTVKVALAGNVDYLDPALAYYQSSWQIEYSTCVKLTNYKDAAGDAGRVIYPEAATAMPDISSDGLTYTYTVPSGPVQVQHRRAGHRAVVPARAGARPESQPGLVLRIGVPGPRDRGRVGLQGQAGRARVRHHGAGRQADHQAGQAGRRPDLEADDAVCMRHHQGHAGRRQGRACARRCGALLRGLVLAEPFDRAEEESQLDRRGRVPSAGLSERDRLRGADREHRSGHAADQERRARLLAGRAQPGPVLPAEQGVRAERHVGTAAAVLPHPGRVGLVPGA